MLLRKQQLQSTVSTKTLVVSVVGRILKNRIHSHSSLHKIDGSRNNRVCEFTVGHEHMVGEVDFFILGQTPLAMIRVTRKVQPAFEIRNSRLRLLSSREEYVQSFIKIEKFSIISQKMCTLT